MEKRALTVAGSDSGGGAGIQADLKTFTALSVFGSSVIVALTAQNSVEVSGILEVPSDFVEKQMDAVLSDIGTDAAKTGMLFSQSIIKSVTKKFREYGVEKIVVDPVMVSKTNARLLKEDAVSSLVTELAPISYLITPNGPEAEIISNVKIRNADDVMDAALRIHDESGCRVLIKGGHFEGESSVDTLYDGSKFYHFSGKRIDTQNTHGTGDTLSAGITAFLSKGLSLKESVERSREFLQGTIENSFPMGKGFGSLMHYWKIKRNDE